MPLGWSLPEIGYHDLQFRQARLVESETRWRWIDVGMPRIGPHVTKSVFYFFARGQDGKIETTPTGTGVVVQRESTEVPGTSHHYAVSNRHVVHQCGASIIRFNTHFGTRFEEFDPSEWQFTNEGDDVCAVCIDGRIQKGLDVITCAPEDSFVTQKMIHDLGIRTGEDVFMVGLFASHDGGKSNHPMSRFGNLSMVANESNPVRQQVSRQDRAVHIVDVRSRSGFSGSPVFVYRIYDTDLETVNEHPRGLFFGGTEGFMKFLGIHVSQFGEPIEVTVMRPNKTEAKGTPIHEGDVISIPSSMTCVAPAWTISEVLDLPKFVEQRRIRDEERKSRRASIPTAEAVAAVGALPEPS